MKIWIALCLVLSPCFASYDFNNIEIENIEEEDVDEDFFTEEKEEVEEWQWLSKHVQGNDIEEELIHDFEPYLLPDVHPVKGPLDAIFSKKRILSSKAAMKKAGFDVLKHPQRDMIIARHPKIKGYLIKAYLDNKKIDELFWWKRRIAGVRQVQECIDRHGFNAMMKTPKKWIYQLPPEPIPADAPNVFRKYFILVVEDMNILTRKKTLLAYKNNITPEWLDALYIVLTENLLADSMFAPNIPFCHDGKIAILDTEDFNNTSKPMKLWKMAAYLSPEMLLYWDQLIQEW